MPFQQRIHRFQFTVVTNGGTHKRFQTSFGIHGFHRRTVGLEDVMQSFRQSKIRFGHGKEWRTTKTIFVLVLLVVSLIPIHIQCKDVVRLEDVDVLGVGGGLLWLLLVVGDTEDNIPKIWRYRC